MNASPVSRLAARYPQLLLAIEEHAKDTPEYKDVVLRGKPVFGEPDFLGSPEDELSTVDTPVGRVDVLTLGNREDFEHALRALELYIESLPLLSQNEDPEIGELTIYGGVANAHQMLGENQKALEILKQHNAGGYYCDRIGLMLTDNSGTDEAIPYLSEALTLHVTALVHTVMGYLNVYMNRGDFPSANAILHWLTGMLSGLRRPETPSHLDKVNGPFFACMAFSRYKMGETDAARASLQSAKRIAEAFDAAPNYDWEAVRFVEHPEKMSAYDDLGATAMQSVESVIKSFEDEAFSAMWNEINEQDK